MRQSPSFTFTDVAEVHRVIEENLWVTIVSATDKELVALHYVVLHDKGHDELTFVGHVGRPDDIVHGLRERELMVVFQGSHGHVSPAWYGDAQGVPTWNYIAVHLSGVAEILDDENLKALDRMVDRFEARMPEPHLLWERSNDPAYVTRPAAGNLGFRLTPSRVSAKRKLSQNKPEETVEAVIASLAAEGPYENGALAAEIRRVHDARHGDEQ